MYAISPENQACSTGVNAYSYSNFLNVYIFLVSQLYTSRQLWLYIQWAKKLIHEGSKLSCKSNCGPGNKDKRVGNCVVTKLDILSFVIIYIKHVPLFVDFILTLEWSWAGESAFLHTWKLALHTQITWLNLKYHVISFQKYSRWLSKCMSATLVFKYLLFY